LINSAPSSGMGFDRKRNNTVVGGESTSGGYDFKHKPSGWAHEKNCFICDKKFKSLGMKAKRHHW